VSPSGSVLDAITYDPYGNLYTQTNSNYEPRFGYAGGALDGLTGDYQFGARYYNAADGRWESEDPLGFEAGDANLYRYAFNDPTTGIDPTGEFFWIPFLIGAALVGGGTGGLYYTATQYDETTKLYRNPPSPQNDALIAAQLNYTQWWEAGSWTSIGTGGGMMVGGGGSSLARWGLANGYRKTVYITGGSLFAGGVADTVYQSLPSQTPWSQLNWPQRVKAGGQLYGPWAGGFAGGLLDCRFPLKRGPVHLDIGGEGRYPGAINVNTNTTTSTTGTAGRPIPNLVQATGERLPFGNQVAEIITIENTPINQAIASEVDRVIKQGGVIRLVSPADYALVAHQRVIQALPPGATVTQTTVGTGETALTTTIIRVPGGTP
jgi:RHS repeat-associated protein